MLFHAIPGIFLRYVQHLAGFRQQVTVKPSLLRAPTFILISVWQREHQANVLSCFLLGDDQQGGHLVKAQCPAQQKGGYALSDEAFHRMVKSEDDSLKVLLGRPSAPDKAAGFTSLPLHTMRLQFMDSIQLHISSVL